MELKEFNDTFVQRTSTPLFGHSSNNVIKHETSRYGKFRTKLRTPMNRTLIRGCTGPVADFITGHLDMNIFELPPIEYTFVMFFPGEFNTISFEQNIQNCSSSLEEMQIEMGNPFGKQHKQANPGHMPSMPLHPPMFYHPCYLFYNQIPPN